MSKCPFCQQPLNEAEIRPGRMATCRACGKSIAPGAFARTPVSLPAPTHSTGEPEYDEDEDDSQELEPDNSFVYRVRHLDPATLTAFLCGALALGLPALASLSFTTAPLAYLSKFLSGAGLLIGVLASLMPAVKKRKSIAIPVVVCLLCFVVFVLAGPWPLPSPQTGLPPTPMAIPLDPHAQEAPQPVKEDDWVDAGKYLIRNPDLSVRLLSARVLPVEALGKARPAKVQGKVLVLLVRVSKESPKLQPVRGESWGDTPTKPSAHPAVLTDNKGQGYPQIPIDALKVPRSVTRIAGPPTPDQPEAPPPPDSKDKSTSAASAKPLPGPEQPADRLTGHPADEVLVFPPPRQDAEYLRLALPESAFGLQGTFRLQIPRGKIQEP